MQDMEQAIRERAYHLWVADGRRDGSADQHWLAAQRDVLAASLGDIGRVTTKKPRATATIKKAAAAKGEKASKPKARHKAA